MNVFDIVLKKLGFTAEESDERSEELEEDEVQAEDEDEDDEEEVRSSRRFSMNNPFRSRQQEEDPQDEREPQKTAQRTSTRHGNVIHDARMDARASQEPQYTHYERVVYVRQIEACGDIIKCLLSGESILLNLENIDPKDCTRVVDLLSGAAYALGGRMLKVAHLSYLLAPKNVKVIEEESSSANRVYR